MSKSPRVYLAGPEVFAPGFTAITADLRAACARHGLVGVCPLDGGLDLAGLAPKEAASRIFRANVELLDGADAVLASIAPFRGPGLDGGTSWEMGWAFARGLPVVGYLPDRHSTFRPSGLTDYGPKAQAETYRERAESWGILAGTDDEGNWVDEEGWLVEDFGLPDNIMPACCCSAVEIGAEAALRHLAALLLRTE